MSVAPSDSRPYRHHQRALPPIAVAGGCGFVFAFFRYSQMKRIGVIETLVHYALRSDCIHVAIVPAPYVEYDSHDGEIRRIVVHDITFTAFMGYGYEEDGAESVLNDQYEYVFVPLSRAAYTEGLRFLFSLQGRGYNYMGLPFTVLPTSWKTKKHKKREQQQLMFNYSNNNKNNNNNNNNLDDQKQCGGGGGCAPSRVFCSQVGLMLCYRCNLLLANSDDASIDPASCSPGELKKLLLQQRNKNGAVKCPQAIIEIESPENNSQLLFQC